MLTQDGEKTLVGSNDNGVAEGQSFFFPRHLHFLITVHKNYTFVRWSSFVLYTVCVTWIPDLELKKKKQLSHRCGIYINCFDDTAACHVVYLL